MSTGQGTFPKGRERQGLQNCCHQSAVCPQANGHMSLCLTVSWGESWMLSRVWQ